MISKIKMLIICCGSIALVSAGISCADDTALIEAKKILDKAPIADGHNDLPWLIRETFASNVEGYDIFVRAQFDTDIPRLREGKVGIQFWSVYVPTTMSPEEAMQTQLEPGQDHYKLN